MSRSALLILTLGIRVFAAAPDSARRLAPACGPNDVSFSVSTSKTAPQPSAADANSAVIYVIEDDSLFQSFPRPTVKTGLDGEWVGATHGNSYFMFPISPGEHHLCFAWQSRVVVTVRTSSMAAAHSVNVKPGDAIYFRVRNVFARPAEGEIQKPPRIFLDALDQDEGQLLTNRFSLSISQRKK
jgi:hypothetical protein